MRKAGKPKPSVHKKLAGTDRADRKRPDEPKPPIRELTPPADLDADALAFWQRKAPQLAGLGLLTVVDGDALEGAARCYSRWIRAERYVAEFGASVYVDDRPVRRPEVITAETAMREFRQWLCEFGMTPSARTRVAVTPPNPVPAPREGEAPQGENVVNFKFGFNS